MKPLLLLLLALWVAGRQGAQAQVDWSDATLIPTLEQQCGLQEPLPEFNSDSAFIGALLRANTSQTSYAYYRFGNTSSALPPLLMVPGAATSITSWGVELLHGLAAAQEVVAFEHRGQGSSEDLRPGERLTVEGMAEDVLSLIETIGLDRPNILGWSLGGMIATAIVAREGSKVNDVVLASAIPGGRNSVEGPASALYNLGATQLEADRNAFDVDSPAGLEAWCKHIIGQRVARQSPINALTTNAQGDAVWRWFSTGVWDLLPDVSNRVLHIAGGEDPLTPADNARIMSERIPNSWLAVYSEARHGVLFEDVPSVVEVINSFLANELGESSL